MGYKQGSERFAACTECPGIQVSYPVPLENKYRIMALQVEVVSEIETIKYAHEFCGTQTWERARW
jgi:hypothetical protein